MPARLGICARAAGDDAGGDEGGCEQQFLQSSISSFRAMNLNRRSMA